MYSTFYSQKPSHVPIQRIIIVGKGGSGKDYLCNAFTRAEVKNIKYTTRPKRPKEVHGTDYNFVDEYTFGVMLDSNAFKQHEEFNEWKYGISCTYWDVAKVFIMTPIGISTLSPKDIQESYIVYLDIDETVRKERLERRMGRDTVERRLYADLLDFAEFFTYDYKIIDSMFDAEAIACILENQLDTWEPDVSCT